MHTPGINQTFEPHNWQEHFFGLSKQQRTYLKNRSFWVTGAGTGYGQAISVVLSLLGATVFLSGRRREKLSETIAQVSSLGGNTERIFSIPCNIIDAQSVQDAVLSIQDRASSLFGLIHGAALSQPACGQWPLMDMPCEKWKALFDTNVMGAWLVTKHALPLMLKGEAQRIVYLTSEAGWADTNGFGPYNISKAALNNLGMSFSAEVLSRYPEKDFQLNVLIPGEARTEMNQGSDISPYSLVHMLLTLLLQPINGPQGKFFHKDGRHFPFAYADAYNNSL